VNEFGEYNEILGEYITEDNDKEPEEEPELEQIHDYTLQTPEITCHVRKQYELFPPHNEQSDILPEIQMLINSLLVP
ncbi:3877_t:CDS:1, partial [Funneliformis mosseae]